MNLDIHRTNHNHALCDDCHEQGWNDCLHEWKQQDKLKRKSTVSLERFALIITTACLLAIASLRWCGVTGNLTNSEPRGLYLKVPGQPHRGDIVLCRSLIKRLTAEPGDIVRLAPEGTYVNNQLIPNSSRDITRFIEYGYHPMPFRTYPIHPGQYWLTGHSRDSWDSSTAFAQAPQDLIESRLEPLWTFGK